MDVGYDERGNRIESDEDGSARVEELGTGESTRHPHNRSSNGRAATRSLSSGAPTHENSTDLEASASDFTDTASSQSDFSDDVELIIGEVGNQALDQPLAEASVPGRLRAMQGSAVSAFWLEDRKAGASTLLIGDRAVPIHSFLDTVSRIPSRIKNLALLGSLHHGKTSLLRLLLKGKDYHQRQDEKDRRLSLKTHVLSTLTSGGVLQTTSQLVTFVDTPGHPDFFMEAVAGLRLADVALFCVDAAESVDAMGERLLRHIVLQEQMPVILVLTKVDRLILDLKLPPRDAYRKLRLSVDAVNNIIASCGAGTEKFLVSPENGSVCFTSAKLGFFFSLEVFALKYAALYPGVNASELAPCLWGQVTFEQGCFKKITTFAHQPTFVSFILEPLYKIVAHAAIGKGSEVLSHALSPLPRSPLSAIQEAVRHFCGDPSAEGMDTLLCVLPLPGPRAEWLNRHYGLEACFSGSEETEDLKRTTVTAIAPFLCMIKEGELAAVVRVLRGAVHRAKSACHTSSFTTLVLVDSYANEMSPFHALNPEGLYVRTAEDGFVAVDVAYEGQVVYLTGTDLARVGSHFALVGGRAASGLLCENGMLSASEEVALGACSDTEAGSSALWLDHVKVKAFASEKPLIHVSLELKEPTELDRLQKGLDVLLRTSPGLDIHKEETGEFTLTGFGELHLDTALYQLRKGLCAGVRLGISQPYVTFSETVLDNEGVLAFAGTRKAGVGCTSGALLRHLTSAIEYERLELFPDEPSQMVKLWTTLRKDYQFDGLDAQHVLAVGPDKTKGPSLLIDDTLEEELRGPISTSHRQSMIAGFRAAVAAGPLISDVVRGVAVKIVIVEVEADTRAPLVLSNTRAAVRQALIGARPRLLEPVFSVEILCQPECIEKLADILRQRRGAVMGEEAVAATTLVRVKAVVPAMDSFGLETQIRMLTHGQAFPFFSFAQWDMVPGDPYDASICVPPLEPARGHQLARDFVLKTRFRKGLSLNLSVDL